MKNKHGFSWKGAIIGCVFGLLAGTINEILDPIISNWTILFWVIISCLFTIAVISWTARHYESDK